ncbi:sugar phosphate isomerase/epimerase [Bacillus cereus ATCC 10876]|uniref:sugar phosphate isomerase/epimerase family protein n=1 Tax=Bacillus TaxID=1386 RepID=UPI00019FF3A6|nr:MULTISPECIES: sugar phosphate isomerase/epimerase family protein [Bacillus]MDJ0281818.1 sugar phosphate isomerase/epimerase family protein [Bacillus bombysepticus]EEK49893.1 Xylose isomerase domain protein TIM barrel [Bacillus cereus ATCC 10876]KFL63639.1 xylose isomerase-like TIM barrel family protein [Bacillus cereus ATCC 10876]MBO1131977.1 sugar phosphate isomerase/epimerase [Bacillus cereus]MDJ0295907.1 sugar phosphate isomerase/epimerase family protein [Bacillus bombysepticus]
MKLAYSSNGFKRYDLLKTIDVLSEIGYEGIEILLDIPHAFPPEVTNEKILMIKDKLKQKNMTISNLNAFMLYGIKDNWHPSFVEVDETERRQRIEHTHNCIDLAQKLGAKTLSTEPGGPLINVGREWANKVFISAMEELADHAEKSGVTILVEPEPDLLIETSDQFIEFKKAVPSQAIALNFDIGHFFCVGEDPAALVYKLLPYTQHYHLEDIAVNRVHEHLIPGHGAIPILEVLQSIKKTGYDGFITIELYPYENHAISAAKESYDYVQSILNSL